MFDTKVFSEIYHISAEESIFEPVLKTIEIIV